MKTQICEQADPFCKGLTRTECFSCGKPVCTACSSLRVYLPYYGRARLCNNCQEQYDGNDRFIVRRAERMAKGK